MQWCWRIGHKEAQCWFKQEYDRWKKDPKQQDTPVQREKGQADIREFLKRKRDAGESVEHVGALMKELDPNFVMALFDGSIPLPTVEGFVGGNLDYVSELYAESVYKFIEGNSSVIDFLGHYDETECEPCLPADAYGQEDNSYSWSEDYGWPDDGHDWSEYGYSWSDEYGWSEFLWADQHSWRQTK